MFANPHCIDLDVGLSTVNCGHGTQCRERKINENKIKLRRPVEVRWTGKANDSDNANLKHVLEPQ